MIKERHKLYGKILERIEVDSEELDMFNEMTIYFTDGCKIRFKTDWYPEDCYIAVKELKTDDRHITIS